MLETFEGEQLMFGACLLPKDLGELRSSLSSAWEIRLCEVWTSEMLPKYLSEPVFYCCEGHSNKDTITQQKTFNWGGLRFSPFSSWQGVGRLGTGEEVESSTY